MDAQNSGSAEYGVSVVIPAYNSADLLEGTLESVLAQNRPAQEIVIVDDGSTDETPGLLDAYAAKYPELVRVVRQRNLGPAEARNRGILAASQPFVALLDHDDRWTRDKLEHQMGFLAADPTVAISATGYVYHLLGEEPIASVITGWQDAPEPVLHRLLISNCILTSTVVARRQLLIDVGLFEPSLWWGDEYDLWLRIASAGHRISYLPQALTAYTRGPLNLSSIFYRQGVDAYIPVMKRRFDAHDLPASIQTRRRWYLAHRYLNNACGYLETQHYELAVRSLTCAVTQRPASTRPGWLVILFQALLGLARGVRNEGQSEGMAVPPASA